MVKILAALLLTGCISAEVSVEQVCSSNNFIVDSTEAISEQSFRKIVEHDVSEPLKKVSDVADLNLDSLNLDLSGDVRNIKHIKAILHGDGKSIVLVDASPVIQNESMKLDLNTKEANLIKLLSSGPVDLELILTGEVPKKNTEIKTIVCASASAKIKKSLSDL